MWHCNDCKNDFDFPEVKRPDVGMVSDEGILGLRKLEPVKFCPVCLSKKIFDCDEGLINTVELAIDWHLSITDEMFDEYTRLINKRQQPDDKIN